MAAPARRATSWKRSRSGGVPTSATRWPACRSTTISRSPRRRRRHARSSPAWPRRVSTSSRRSNGRRRRPARSRRRTRTSSPGPAPMRPAARRRSPSSASPTGSAAPSTTCAPSAPRSRSRSSPRSSSSRRSSCPICGRPARTSSSSWPCSIPRKRLARLVERALEIGLEPLVEAHDERELERALATGARLIGINNRDLRTLAVDTDRAIRLRELVPDDRLVVAESGVRDPATVAAWRAVGLRCGARRRGARPGRRSGRRGTLVRRGRPSPDDPANRGATAFVKVCGVTDAEGSWPRSGAVPTRSA